jgi:hypothetical protein
MKISLRKPERKRPVERQFEDGRIILKCNFKEIIMTSLGRFTWLWI